MFSLDLSEKIRPPEEEVVSLVQMVHEVVGSKIFKDTYTDICVSQWGSLGEPLWEKWPPRNTLHLANPQEL